MTFNSVGQWLYDWQTLLAGVLAVIAAAVASFAAYSVGKRQVSVVETQNKEMRQRESRAIDREVKISAGLCGAIFRVVLRNIQETDDAFAQDQHPPLFDSNWKPQKRLTPPPIYQVLDHLGKLDNDLIEAYFALCFRIDRFRAETVPAREDFIRELKDIFRIASDLSENMERRYGRP